MNHLSQANSTTPAKRDDMRWFKQYPQRRYRLRLQFPNEYETGNAVAVDRQLNRIPVQVGALFNTETDAQEYFEGIAA